MKLLLAVVFIIVAIYPLDFFWMKSKAANQGMPGPSWLTLASYGFWVVATANLIFQYDQVFGARAKASEAHGNLSRVYTAQQAYLEAHGEYAGGDHAFEIMGYEPDGQIMYSYYCGSDVVVNRRFEPVVERPGSNWPYEINPGTRGKSFTCMAVGNVDWDDFMDVWSVNDNKDMKRLRRDDNNNGRTELTLGTVKYLLLIVSSGLFIVFKFRDERSEAKAREATERDQT